MNNIATAREFAVEAIQEFCQGQEPTSESWLVQKGFVVGRRFYFESVSAVWFFESDEMKVYDPAGKVLKVVGDMESRKAA